MKPIATCLWFEDQAEEAAKFYTAVFKHSKMLGVTRYGEAGAQASGRPKGSVMTASFQLQGHEFLALNGGPQFTFSPAISLIVNCDSQQEVDEIWQKLSEGGQPGQCGWLTDKYGVSWQIVPTILGKMLLESDAQKSERVMSALIQMEKFDIKTLEQAALGR